MFRTRFTTEYEQHADREGQPFTVLRKLTDEERDPEVGTMYRIRFDDKVEIDAWPEEVQSQLAAAITARAISGGVAEVRQFLGLPVAIDKSREETRDEQRRVQDQAGQTGHPVGAA